MTLAKLYSKNPFKHTYIDEIKKNTPFTITYLIACFVTLYLPALVILVTDSVSAHEYLPYDGYVGYVFSLSPFIVFLFPVFAFILPLIQFAYLTNKRAMDVYAAIPMKRGDAISAKVLAGATMLLAPPILMMLASFVTNIIFLGFNSLLVAELFFIIFEAIVFILLPYMVVVFVSTLSGTIAENILYSLVLILTPFIIYGTYNLLLELEIYGFVLSENMLNIMGYMLPYWGYFERVMNNSEIFTGITNEYLYNLSYSTNVQGDFSIWEIISQLVYQGLLWIAVTIGMFVASLQIYKSRKSEKAGIKGASKILSTIALYVSVILGAITFYFIMGAIFGENTRFIFLFAGTIVGFVIFQLVVLQSTKAMLKSSPKLLVALIFFGALTAFVQTQGFGIYNYVPQSGIVSVEVGYNPKIFDKVSTLNKGDYTTEDAEIIAYITELNEVILDTYDKNGENWSVDNYYYGNRVDIVYTLENGMKIERYYDSLSLEASVKLDELNFKEDYAKDMYYVLSDDFKGIEQATITDIATTNISPDVLHENAEFDMEIFAEKLKSDILANLSVEALSTQETVGLFVYSRYTPEETMEMYGYEEVIVTDNAIDDSHKFIAIKSGYTETIAYLASIGLDKYFEVNFAAIKQMSITDDNAVMGYYESTYREDILNYFNKELLYSQSYYEYNYMDILPIETQEGMEKLLENATYFAPSAEMKSTVVIELVDGNIMELAVK